MVRPERFAIVFFFSSGWVITYHAHSTCVSSCGLVLCSYFFVVCFADEPSENQTTKPHEPGSQNMLLPLRGTGEELQVSNPHPNPFPKGRKAKSAGF